MKVFNAMLVRENKERWVAYTIKKSSEDGIIPVVYSLTVRVDFNGMNKPVMSLVEAIGESFKKQGSSIIFEDESSGESYSIVSHIDTESPVAYVVIYSHKEDNLSHVTVSTVGCQPIGHIAENRYAAVSTSPHAIECVDESSFATSVLYAFEKYIKDNF